MRRKKENEKNVYEKMGELTGQVEEGEREPDRQKEKDIELMQDQVYDGPVVEGPMDVMEKVRRMNEDPE